MSDNMGTISIPVDKVDADPDQHRKFFDEDALDSLAESIRSVGQLTPIVVTEAGDRYLLVDGERRYRAHVRGGMTHIMATVVDVSESQRASIQAAANLARENVRPSEAGHALKRSIDALMAERPWLGEDEARREAQKALGVGTRFANARLALITLPPEVYGLVDKGSLKLEAALALLPLVERGEDAEAVRQARAAVARGYSVAQVSDAVQEHVNADAQGSLFGGADVGRESAEVRETRSVLARLVAIYERAQAVAFDDRKQEFDLGDLRTEDLAITEAKLAGAANVIHRFLSEVQAAQGKTPDLHAEPVVPRAVEPAQTHPAVGVAQEGAGQVPTPQNAPQRPTVRQAVLTEPERVEFGGEVRVATVGTWLWVSGVGSSGRSSLAYAIEKAGARWASGRQAWYCPREDDQERVQAVLRKYLSQPSEPSVTSEPTGAEWAQAAG